jgi:hypothetical protein
MIQLLFILCWLLSVGCCFDGCLFQLLALLAVVLADYCYVRLAVISLLSLLLFAVIVVLALYCYCYCNSYCIAIAVLLLFFIALLLWYRCCV